MKRLKGFTLDFMVNGRDQGAHQEREEEKMNHKITKEEQAIENHLQNYRSVFGEKPSQLIAKLLIN